MMMMMMMIMKILKISNAAGCISAHRSPLQCRLLVIFDALK